MPRPPSSLPSARPSGPPYTILFTPASNVLFHVGRCVRVAAELAARGHRVIFAGTDRYLADPAVATTADFELYPLPDFDPEEGMDLLRSIWRKPSRARVQAMVRDEIDLIRKLQPDLVVSDFRPTMGVSARACGVPLVSLMLTHWMPGYASNPEWVPRSYALGAWAVRLAGPALSRRLAPPIFRGIIRRKTAPFRAAARLHGQTSPELLWEHLEGDLNLLTDADGLSELPLPPHYRRVGPIVWEPEMPWPGWVSRLDPERPLLLANFGSTGHPDLFRRTFEELAEGPQQVVLATCGQVDARSFHVPENFFVETFVPVSRILERADLVIYHGGAGTFQQALCAGVPGLVVATHWDQEYAGYISEKLGIGDFLTLRQVLASPGLLGDTTAQLLARLPTLRSRAEELQRRVQADVGPKGAADAVEALLASGISRAGAPVA